MRRYLTGIFLIGLLSCERRQPSTEEQSNALTTVTKKDSVENNGALPACSYSNAVSDLGSGIVIAPTRFEIFNDSLLLNKFSSIDMYEEKMDFCSMFFKPDYGIMHFACIGESEKSYKVLTGFSEYKFLPKTDGYEFKTWDEYILESFGIRREYELNPKQPLQEQPSENSKRLNIPEGYELFCPMEVKNDWIKVKYDCFYNLEDNPNEGEPCHNYIDKCTEPLTGWLKWRNKNEILIDIFLMP